MLEKIRKFAFIDGEDFTDDDIKKIIQQDYSDLINLRNRLAEPDTIIYEEDYLLLDHILDYIEIICKEIY